MKSHAWCLETEQPYITHLTDSIYLANGVFGGLLDGSGTNMDLWSASVGSRNSVRPGVEVLYPVTLLRTRVFYRNPYFRSKDFWIGRDGIVCDDARYTSDPSMPHLAQVYRIRQQLDLRRGIAETKATLYPGTEAALLAGRSPERQIPFRSRVAFLKNSPWMGLEIETEENTELLFAPELILEEHVKLDVSAKGVCKIGSGIDCHLSLHQTVLDSTCGTDSIGLTLQAEGCEPHELLLTAPGARVVEFQGRPAFIGQGKMQVYVRILPPDHPPETRPGDFFGAQACRWEDFWSRASVTLPLEEDLWQQRYHASLFYVAQSIGRGPTHPVGLSKPNYPHWNGCFHDTDTYFCRPLLESGRAMDAFPHLAYRHRYLDEAKRIAASQELPGALYPWQSDMNGKGAAQPCPVNSAIIACEAWNHYLHTRCQESRGMARDILLATFEHLCVFAETGSTPMKMKPGNLLTFSETMLAEQPTEALLSLRAVAAALRECGDVPESVGRLADRVLHELHPPRKAEGGYRFCPGGEPEYLRCPSVILGAFPLHQLPADGDLHITFDEELAKIVFLFAWLPHQASVVASQLQRREGPASASSLLRQADSFYKGYHAYDEWENRRTGRAENFVTAAGGFCTALHHLLLAETAERVWSLFPGIPPEWGDLSFRNLHTRAGWVVSAELKDGKLGAWSAEPAGPGASPAFTLCFQGVALECPPA